MKANGFWGRLMDSQDDGVSSKTFIMVGTFGLAVLGLLVVLFVMIWETIVTDRTLSGGDFVAILGGLAAMITAGMAGKAYTDGKRIDCNKSKGYE